MTYDVFVPANPDEDDQFDPCAQYAMWWNVHSDYNEGYRATDVLWEWFRNHAIECYEWSISHVDEHETHYREGATFQFEKLEAARQFALAWT